MSSAAWVEVAIPIEYVLHTEEAQLLGFYFCNRALGICRRSTRTILVWEVVCESGVRVRSETFVNCFARFYN